MEKNNFLIIEKEGSDKKQEFEIISERNLKKIDESAKIPEKEEKKTSGDLKRTKCEVYSRVVGYFRPVSQWNEGKQAEWEDRKMFKVRALVEIKQKV
ncbi:MAG: anaerobic ribonucleoside-triphosphate reductase [archaeon]